MYNNLYDNDIWLYKNMIENASNFKSKYNQNYSQYFKFSSF